MPPKKSAAEKEAERLAAEEEARKQQELEEKKAAIEAEKRRVEEARIAAERRAQRIAELDRLVAEFNAYLDNRKEKDEQRAKEEKLEANEIEWALFKDPSDEPSARSEIDTNSFLGVMASQPCQQFAQLNTDVVKIQKLAMDIEKCWSESSRDWQLQDRLLKSFQNCISLVKTKCDTVTAHTLKFADLFLSVDGKCEVLIEEAAGDTVLAMWASFLDLRPNRKKIDSFDKLGATIDLPKQVLQVGILLVRLIRSSFNAFNCIQQQHREGASQSPHFVVGDVLTFELCVPPPQSTTIRAKRWVIRDSSQETESLKYISYPVSAKSTIVMKLNPTVVMSDDLKLAVYNEATGEWSEDGITDFQYSESERKIQFYTTVCGTIALIKNRVADFPYKKWSLQPICDKNTMKAGSKGPNFERQARFSISTFRHDIVIDIIGSQCCLVQPAIEPLSDLIGVLMLPGCLLHKLQRRGINISPLYADSEKIEGCVPKVQELEDDVLFAMSRCASALEFKNSTWNKDISKDYIGILVRESSAYLGLSDLYDYECVLAEMDNVSESHKFTPDVPLCPNRSCSHKFTLVYGNEYGDKKNVFSHTPRPKEVPHCVFSESLSARVSPEAQDRLHRTNERFANAVYLLLSLVKPYSF